MNEWVSSISEMILTRETEVLREKHYTASVVDEWMSMEHWWNDTDRGNWSTGRKTLFNVGGSWMNEYGFFGGMILTGETEVLGEKHYTALVVVEWMTMDILWNDTDRGNWSTGRKTLYSFGGRWMNESGALVEWYWQGKLKYWLKYWEKNIIQRRW